VLLASLHLVQVQQYLTLPFEDCKDDLVKIVKEQLPTLGVKDVNEALVTGIASALFILIKNYPQIVETLKKVKKA
jgi:hypothetical protein